MFVWSRGNVRFRSLLSGTENGHLYAFRGLKQALTTDHQWSRNQQQFVPVSQQSNSTEPKQIAKFCAQCGGAIKLAVPPRETELRHICTSCSAVTYYNPKMVVGVICEHEGKILMCKRATQPCAGLWTLPAGYMEMHESSVEGAVRETLEEACARVQVIAPYAHFDIPWIGQSYLLFRAKLLEPYCYGSSPESQETAMVPAPKIPFDQIAFSAISLALQFYLEDLKQQKFKMHHGVIEKAPGSLPNDPSTFRLRDHFSITVQDVAKVR